MASAEQETALRLVAKPPGRTAVRLRSVFRQLRANPLAFVGTVIVLVFLLMAVFGPVIAPYGPEDQSGDLRQPPSALHLFGTDNLGRDVFSRVLVGSRDIVSLAGFGTVIAVVIGTAVGLTVTYEGGWIEELTMRLMDSMLSLPAGMLALLLLGAVGPSRESVLLVIIIVYIPIVARVVRSVVLDIKTRGFVDAARLRGERRFYVLTREILPSVIPTLVV